MTPGTHYDPLSELARAAVVSAVSDLDLTAFARVEPALVVSVEVSMIFVVSMTLANQL